MAPIARTIYVLSDLHLGGEAEKGRRGFRICTHETELAAFIASLDARQNHPSVLVLNGDTLDFLAEKVSTRSPLWTAFRKTEQAAIDCLETIARRCAVVFDALRSYLAKG